MKMKERGITLIALVISIIIIIILAAVTTNVLMGTGIIDKGTDAAKKYEEAQYDESKKLDDIIKELDKLTVPGNLGGDAEQKELISFTVEIRGKEETFYAEQGMTWGEFIESEYNSNTYTVGSSQGSENQEPGERVFTYYYDGFEYFIVTYSGLTVDGDHGPAQARDVISSDILYKANGAACVAGDTEIMVSKTNHTVEAKDIKEDDEIAYYNFEKEKIEIGKVSEVYIHKDATNFVKYTFEDGTYLEATDYHPIYTKNGWKSLTRRNGYEIPVVGDDVKQAGGWKKITKIETWTGLEDCYDFAIIGEDGKKMNNYFANGTLVQSSI